VAMLRLSNGSVEYLVLGDAVLVLDLHERNPLVVHDPRELTISESYRPALEAAGPGTEAYQGILNELRARRNRPGGFWVAKDDPRAADEALTGSCPIAELDGAVLLSNGASRVVDPYGLLDWRACMQVLHSTGPHAFLRRLRQHEEGRPDGPPVDDASVTFADFRRPPRGQPAGPDAAF